MRKNAPRKWIHAILDLLPLFVIPIFAININQKSVEPISLQVQEKVSVDFNQLRKDEIVDNRIGMHVSSNESLIQIYGTATVSTAYSLHLSNNYSIENHQYLIRLNNYINAPKLRFYSFKNQGSGTALYSYTFDTYSDLAYRFFTLTENNCSFELGILTTNETEYESYIYLNLFDLTEMNLENVDIQTFNQMFPNENYSYTESQKILINKSSPTTYDSTDIGSQFLYSIYKPVNDYFNFNNLFNMNDVWNWIQLNLFSGSAPLPVFIVWNIILYEFFIDLIFLLYSVFMFIIDFATNCLERPFNKVR